VIFLLDYDRVAGQLVKITSQVVLLEARNETALRRTHRRYFEDLAELAESPK
jgi:hypothetical protein